MKKRIDALILDNQVDMLAVIANYYNITKTTIIEGAIADRINMHLASDDGEKLLLKYEEFKKGQGR